MLGAVERGEQGSHRIRGSGYGTSPIPREASRRPVATKPLRPPPKAAADLCAGAGVRAVPSDSSRGSARGDALQSGAKRLLGPSAEPTYFWTLPTAPTLPAACPSPTPPRGSAPHPPGPRLHGHQTRGHLSDQGRETEWGSGPSPRRTPRGCRPGQRPGEAEGGTEADPRRFQRRAFISQGNTPLISCERFRDRKIHYPHSHAQETLQAKAL